MNRRKFVAGAGVLGLGGLALWWVQSEDPEEVLDAARWVIISTGRPGLVFERPDPGFDTGYRLQQALTVLLRDVPPHPEYGRASGGLAAENVQASRELTRAVTLIVLPRSAIRDLLHAEGNRVVLGLDGSTVVADERVRINPSGEGFAQDCLDVVWPRDLSRLREFVRVIKASLPSRLVEDVEIALADILSARSDVALPAVRTLSEHAEHIAPWLALASREAPEEAGPILQTVLERVRPHDMRTRLPHGTSIPPPASCPGCGMGYALIRMSPS